MGYARVFRLSSLDALFNNAGVVLMLSSGVPWRSVAISLASKAGLASTAQVVKSNLANVKTFFRFDVFIRLYSLSRHIF